MNTRWGIGLAAAGVAAIAILTIYNLLATDEPSAQATRIRTNVHNDDTALVTGPSAEGRQVSHLTAELAALKGQVAALHNGLSDEAEKAAASAEPELSIAEQREQGQREWKEHMAVVAASYAQEAVDQDWASGMRDNVEKAIASDPLIQAAAGDVECRSRTCRVEISDNGSDLNKQLPTFVESIGPKLANVQADRVQDGEGHVTMVLYMNNDQMQARAH